MNQTIIIEKMGKHDNRNEKTINLLTWTSRAAGKDATRKSICNRIFIDDGLAVATDGGRMHLAYLGEEIENGLYEIVSKTKTKVIMVKDESGNASPDYMRIFTKFTEQRRVSCNGSRHTLFHTVYKHFTPDCSYNDEYLADAYMDHADVSFCVPDKKHDWQALRPLIMYDNNCRAAVVMPLKESNL
jgi:hypothetical protein